MTVADIDSAEPTQPAFPVPASVSAEAQRWLAMPPTRIPYPALDDTDAWLARIKQTDDYVLRRYGGHFPSVPTQETEIAGVHTFTLRPDGVLDGGTGPVYLDIHGGALIAGGGELCGLMASGMALTAGMETWSVDYRMPPLHPYPAALEDCLAVYQALIEARDPADVFVGGRSAGGNLAAALMLRARDEGLRMPAALVLVSPEVDLTESGDSFEINREADNVLASLREVNLLYAGGHDLTDPYLSPLFGDVSGFPPTFLQAGTRDLFLSNAVRMHRTLRARRVEAELHVFEAMPHGGFGGTSPEDREVSAEIRGFLDRHRRHSGNGRS